MAAHLVVSGPWQPVSAHGSGRAGERALPAAAPTQQTASSGHLASHARGYNWRLVPMCTPHARRSCSAVQHAPQGPALLWLSSTQHTPWVAAWHVKGAPHLGMLLRAALAGGSRPGTLGPCCSATYSSNVTRAHVQPSHHPLTPLCCHAWDGLMSAISPPGLASCPLLTSH